MSTGDSVTLPGGYIAASTGKNGKTSSELGFVAERTIEA